MVDCADGCWRVLIFHGEKMRLYLPTQDFHLTSQRVTVPGSTDGVRPNRIVLVSRTVPSGARVKLDIFSAKVVDLSNADQIYFSVERNGSAIASGWEQVPGLQFEYQSQQLVGIELAPGEIQLVAYNISGTSLTDALPTSTDIRCQAWLQGQLLALRDVA